MKSLMVVFVTNEKAIARTSRTNIGAAEDISFSIATYAPRTSAPFAVSADRRFVCVTPCDAHF